MNNFWDQVAEIMVGDKLLTSAELDMLERALMLAGNRPEFVESITERLILNVATIRLAKEVG